MKKAITSLFIAVVLFSCSKEKEPSIIGKWVEKATYRERTQAGVFEWKEVTRWPWHLIITADGKYGGYNDVPTGNGAYEYNRATRELIFKSGSGYTDTQIVSVLTENLMEIDIVQNGQLLTRSRFIRIE